ncbi:aldehyde dehydrogenase family protein [Peribacillus frigoritolerans]|nr:aldehyde dehydrogenase family protein [Peribacillus frigoritolerans]
MQWLRFKKQIDEAISSGAKLEAGGKSISGLFLEPTVLSNIDDSMLCMKEETFGPLAPIASFKTDEEAIKRANDSIFGLAAYVFTENITKGIKFTEALEFGIVGLNDGLPSVPQAPFGGFKQSGLGREGGHQGIEEFLEVKYISFRIVTYLAH